MALDRYLAQNERWAKTWPAKQLETWRKGQTPVALLITCVDSRVAPHAMLDAPPGTFLLHRNIANRVDPQDTSLMATVGFALQALEIERIIVCGHSGCGGIKAALAPPPGGAVGEWVAPIRTWAAGMADDDPDAVAQRHVEAQLAALQTSTPVRTALAEGRRIELYGWFYDVGTAQISEVARHTLTNAP